MAAAAPLEDVVTEAPDDGRTDRPPTIPEPPAGRSSRSPLRLLAVLALAFLLGAGVGAVLAAVLANDGQPQSRRPGTPASPSPVPTPSPGSVSGPAAPCLQAADQASQALEAVQRAATAVGSLDAARLQAALDEVQRLQSSITAQARECRQLFTRPSPSP